MLQVFRIQTAFELIIFTLIIIVVDVWTEFDKNETQINHFQLWINSKGLTIAVDDDSPLSVSINDPEVTHLAHFKTSPIELPLVQS